jgi:hypothetical protein
MKAQNGSENNTNLINSLGLNKTSEELENNSTNNSMYINNNSNNSQDFSSNSKVTSYNFMSNNNRINQLTNSANKSKSSLNSGNQSNHRYHPYGHGVKHSITIAATQEASPSSSSYDAQAYYSASNQYLQNQAVAYAHDHEAQKQYNSQHYQGMQQAIESQQINTYQQLQQQNHQYPVHFYQANIEPDNSNNFSNHYLGLATNSATNGFYYDSNQVNEMTQANGDIENTNQSDFIQAQMDHQASMNTEFYLFNNKQFIQQQQQQQQQQHQQYSNSMDYLNSLNHDQNEHLINLVNSKKQEYAAAKSTSNLYNHQQHQQILFHQNNNNNDSLVPSSSLASSSSISSSAASSPLSSSLNNQDSIAPSKMTHAKNSLKCFTGSYKDKKITNRQSRITAFNLSRANKKQKLSQNMKQQRIQGNAELDMSPKPSKLKQNSKANNKKVPTNVINSKVSKPSTTKSEIKSEPQQQQQPPGQGEPKKRVSANKKERRRTQSINCAFEELRNRIPEIPHDTKLSKIKTLKLATEYIEHLMRLLEEGAPNNGPIEISFKPDLGKLRRECRSKEIKVSFFFLFEKLF